MSTSPSATLQSAQDRSIYILLTRSGTWFSRFIHLVTSDCYTHASIGLDGPSGPFYSFARKSSISPSPLAWWRSGRASGTGRFHAVSMN